MRRLLLMRHAPTRATRVYAFPADEALDERGLAAAQAAGPSLPRHTAVLSSPSKRCLETAEAAGLSGLSVDPALAECDFAGWAGRTLADLAESELAAWMSDPDAAPHGGESLRTFSARVADWLGGQAAKDGSALVVTHGGVVKAAVILALGAPIESFWRVDASPLAITELHSHDGRWTVTRVNVPVAALAA